MITTTKRKTVTNSKQTVTTLIVNPWVLQINKTYPRIFKVAQAFNAKIQPRRGFGYLEPNVSQQQTAIWCLHLDTNPYWSNELSNDESMIIERKKDKETPTEFQKRVTGSRHYRAEVIRITFVKDNPKSNYRFVGVFKLAQFDFERQAAVFRRLHIPKLTVSIQRRKTVEVVIEEEIISITI